MQAVRWLLVAVMLAMISQSIQFEMTEDISSSLELSESDFWPALDPKNQKWLIFFYSETCGHCTAFKPTWTDLTAELKKRDVHMAKVNAPNNTEISSAFGIRGYPTVVYVSNLKYSQFKGQRDKAKLLAWIDSDPAKDLNAAEFPEAPTIFTRLVHLIYVKLMPVETVLFMFLCGILVGYLIAIVTTPSVTPAAAPAFQAASSPSIVTPPMPESAAAKKEK